MTWVKGQTTWQNLSTDLMKLICGEMADSVGVTVAAGDRWVREYDTTSDNIRSPTTKDVATGQCSMRAGYWALLTSNPANGNGYSTYIRQRACFTVKPSTDNRWAYRITITATNSTSGDYSTASVRVQGYNLDGGGGFRSSTITPAADGTVTVDGMTFQIGDPSGFVTSGLDYARYFTTTYLGGIDWWPMYYRRSGAAVFDTAPPGVDGTDFAICEHSYSSSGYTGVSSTSYAGDFGRYLGNGPGTGLGIKTNTGLGANPVYVCHFSMALHKIHIFNGATAGTLAIRMGARTVTDTVAGVGRSVGGLFSSLWARIFTTPGSVTNGAVISYWMSVKPDGIMFILSGDPGLSGQTVCMHVSAFTPYDTQYDVLPVHYSQHADVIGVSSRWRPFKQFGYWRLRKMQDGTEGSRDWQTKWMRADHISTAWNYNNSTGDSVNALAWSGSYYGDLVSDGWGPWAYAWGMSSFYSASNGEDRSLVPPRQLKPHPIDAKWWLYGIPIADVDAWSNYGSVSGPLDVRFVRGVANSRFWALPADGWANLDELTDSSNGNKYMLLSCGQQGIGGQWQNNVGVLGGVAVAEV